MTTYSFANVDYQTDKDMLVIGEKFFQTLPSMSLIPPFSVKAFSVWKSAIHSFLRGCYCLESLIDEDRELYPTQLDTESIDDYKWRCSVFKRRDKALYLVLDRSITLGKDLDEKYSALSTAIFKKSKDEAFCPGAVLFTELQLAVGGSHLHSRIHAVIEAASLRMDRLGGEQAIFNKWKNVNDLFLNLGMDLEMLMKCLLINAVGHIREHQSTIVGLASLSPEQLKDLSPQDIISRFLSSAEHAKGIKGVAKDLALFSHVGDSSKNEPKEIRCFNCNKLGHMSKDCTKPRLKRPAESGGSAIKRVKKI